MAPTFPSEKITLKYPLFSADFFDDDEDTTGSSGGDRRKWLLAVAGGGGEVKSGVGNRITILDVSTFSPPNATATTTESTTDIRLISEIELSKSEDAVMSLAALPYTNGTLLTGINSSESHISSTTTNDHLRGFQYLLDAGVNADGDGWSEIREVWKGQAFSREVVAVKDCYQRILRRSRYRREGGGRGRGKLVALASGGGGGMSGKGVLNEIVIGRFIPPSRRDIDETTMATGAGWDTIERVGLEEGEAADLDIMESTEDGGDGERVVLTYCLPKELYFQDISVNQPGSAPPKRIYNIPTPPPSKKASATGSFRSIRILPTANSCLLLGIINLPSRTGAEILILTSEGKVLLKKPLHKGIKAVTAMDALMLPGGKQAIIAVTGADQAVEVLAMDINGVEKIRKVWIRSVKVMKDVHPFQITKVAIAEPRKADTTGGGVWETRIASTSIGQTIVTFSIPLMTDSSTPASTFTSTTPTPAATPSEKPYRPFIPPPTLYLLSPKGSKRLLAKSLAATTTTIIVSLGLVVTLAVLLQLVFVWRGGLQGLLPTDAYEWERPNPARILDRGRDLWDDIMSSRVKVTQAILNSKPTTPEGGVEEEELKQYVKEAEREDDKFAKHEFLSSNNAEGDESGHGKEKAKEEKEVEDVGDVLKDMVVEAAEVAGEWVIEEGRKVAEGVAKGMLRGAVEDVVQGVMRG